MQTETQNKIPQHVAIIMDGNGRWAQQRGLDRTKGHVAGVESVRRVIAAAEEIGIKYITLYTFSTENWGRPKQEVDMLMELFCKSILNETPELIRNGVRVRIIGSRDGLSEKVISHIDEIENATAHLSILTLVIALNYSSQEEITNGVKLIAEKIEKGEIKVNEIDKKLITSSLYTRDIPDPDLVIRTSGECRLSNFLLWQSAYSELYFTPTLWPDFDKDALIKAVEAYQSRDRRYGLVKDKNNK